MISWSVAEITNIPVNPNIIIPAAIPCRLNNSNARVLSMLTSVSNAVSITPPRMSPTSISTIIRMKNSEPKTAQHTKIISITEGAVNPNKSAIHSKRPIATPSNPMFLT